MPTTPDNVDLVEVDSPPCPGCRKVTTLRVDVSGFANWQRGELIQSALPELTVDDRETLITGYCVPCWDALFAEGDDD